MMINKRTDWQKFWMGRDNPGHKYETLDYYKLYADELMLYFPPGKIHVLELGCGNGVLYNFLRGHFSAYVGIDFSLAMLTKFKLGFSNANLICSDASSLPFSSNKYDFIFSTEVCQNLNKEMLGSNLNQIYNLLDRSGKYLIGNIPDLQLKLFYYASALRGDKDTNWFKAVRRWVKFKVKHQSDGIGYWYSRRAFSQIAEAYGFSCQTYSAATFEYRFHAVLQKME